MKIITKKQEKEQKEETIKKFMFLIMNPTFGADKENARIRAENLYYADSIML